MRARYAVAVAGCVATVLSACGGGLSTSAPIQPGLDVGSVQENEVRVEANPIAPGSSPEQVVSGFIRAAAASDDQYQVARSYLASGPQSSWRPDSSLFVFGSDSEVTYQPSNDDTVTALTVRVQEVEHRLLPQAITLYAEGRLEIDGRRVTVRP